MFPSVPAPAWQRADALPLLAAFALLLPMVLLLPPLPIDETRYLAVAWEMRQGGEFLVPHLNGATYAHKPPLLFWLINAGWLVTGVHAWTARLMTLACSLASLALMHRLAWRLSGSVQVARLATWLLAGTIYFALFANAIMFDVPLTTCVLAALLGVCDLVAGRLRRGVLVTGVAIGLGILVKGPVMLLDIGFVAVLAPWWSAGRLAGRSAAYFGALALAVLLGAAIALAWAIPAALHGGEDYARAIFLKQTFDRIHGVVGTSAHRRPLWWYLAVFPLLLLPWPLVVRGRFARLRGLMAQPALRCALAWLVPTFIVFSLVSGKQPHYLLPLIPALALLLALGLDASILQLRTGLLGAVLVLLGVGLVVLHQLPLQRASAEWVDLVSPWWSVPVIVLGAWLLRWRGPVPVAVPALAILALTLVAKLVVLWGPGVRYDITPIAQRIAALQAQGHAVASMGWHHGVYEFAARLPEPIPAFYTLDDFKAWVQQHPDGYVVTFFRQFRFRATPVFTQPFRGVEVSLWRAQAALAAGVDPNVSHVVEPELEEED